MSLVGILSHKNANSFSMCDPLVTSTPPRSQLGLYGESLSPPPPRTSPGYQCSLSQRRDRAV